MAADCLKTELFQFHLADNLNICKGMCLCILGQSHKDVDTSSRPVNKLKNIWKNAWVIRPCNRHHLKMVFKLNEGVPQPFKGFQCVISRAFQAVLNHGKDGDATYKGPVFGGFEAASYPHSCSTTFGGAWQSWRMLWLLIKHPALICC